MKILFTGGGSGGHFYPLIAVAGEVQKIAEQESLVGLKLYYAAPSPYNKQLLFDNDIRYTYVPAGKIRNYFSILNFFDLFKTGFGVLKAIWTVFRIFPDVIVGKGGFASFPVLLAAKLLRIPVIIHESDTVPGRTNLWASKFASKIAISYPEAEQRFPKETREKIAYTGQPVRPAIKYPAKEGASEYLKLDEKIPTVFVLGGSQGASNINDVILEALPQLVGEFQVIHQVGKAKINEVRETAAVILGRNQNAGRYKPFDYLNDLAIRMAAGASSVVVTRAGSTLFEIAHWKKPAIIVPIPEPISRDQHTNAYEYARFGGAVVVEEDNFNPSILISEVRRITGDPELAKKMGEAAHNEFAREDAARKIAMEALQIALSHVG